MGKSNWATDWNYAHPHGMQGDKPVPFPWRIHFDLPRAPSGAATLTLAIAGAQHAKLTEDAYVMYDYVSLELP